MAYQADPFPDRTALDGLFQAAWGTPPSVDLSALLERSLVHVAAYDADRLIGFVNVAWDGGVHASIFDTMVHPDYRRQGIGTGLVRRAADLARERGAHWLHVDYERRLAPFYAACGFKATSAGLIQLQVPSPT
ncbi:GNAT family N-acetyltransferase [Bauldia sp.]|uniref:GNAT family N-acetyltransferase n=1 Tax=Bauldia sp. TaxID=2575872 RepID=UPI003BAA89F8